MKENRQTHSGSGDNVVGDKIIQYLIPKSIIIIVILLVIASLAIYTYVTAPEDPSNNVSGLISLHDIKKTPPLEDDINV